QEQTHPRPWSRGGAAAERARDLLPVALPVMVGGLLTTISALADALLIPRRLEAAGVLSSQATALYGQWTGMALPVLYLPMVAVYPIETAVLPTISAAHALGQWSRLHRSVAFTTAYAAAVGTLTGAALWAAPGPLVRLLYGDDGAAGLVAALAPAAPFTYVQNMQVPILQGLGRTSVALRNYAVGVCLRLTLLYVLAAVPAVGILAAPLSMAASQALMCVLHGLSIRRATAGR
ncbi:MAG: polysaccharide biosynthesis C-terminal domain-containing protein, partial [Clostridia bacterium]|nr:polysaccharide biosynthesis C-terminal domain-containing protein [Clostridia bacterium]